MWASDPIGSPGPFPLRDSPGFWDAQRQVWGQVPMSLTPLGQYCAGLSDAEGLSKQWAHVSR